MTRKSLLKASGCNRVWGHAFESQDVSCTMAVIKFANTQQKLFPMLPSNGVFFTFDGTWNHATDRTKKCCFEEENSKRNNLIKINSSQPKTILLSFPQRWNSSSRPGAKLGSFGLVYFRSEMQPSSLRPLGYCAPIMRCAIRSFWWWPI